MSSKQVLAVQAGRTSANSVILPSNLEVRRRRRIPQTPEPSPDAEERILLRVKRAVGVGGQTEFCTVVVSGQTGVYRRRQRTNQSSAPSDARKRQRKRCTTRHPDAPTAVTASRGSS
jgi:predicted NBD/HSP70 family sugar kinase